MTPAQTKLYWREWNAAWRAHVARHSNAASPSDPSDLRHQLTAEALGKDKSSKDFTNPELDRVLAKFRAISQPANLNAQLRPNYQARLRVLHKIQHEYYPLLQALGVEQPAGYAAVILRDRFKARQIIDLSDQPPSAGGEGWGEGLRHSQLHQFLFTLARAIDKKRQEKGWSVHDLYSRANLPCPFHCLECAGSTEGPSGLPQGIEG